MLIKPFYALCVSTKREKMLLASISKNLLLYNQISVSVLSPISASLFFIYYSFQNYLRMQTLIVLSFNNTEKNICIRIYRFTNKNEMMKIFYRCLNMLLMDKRF